MSCYEKMITPETFNEILDDLQFEDIEIKKLGITVYFDYLGVRYETNLTGLKRHTVNIGNIMTQFNKNIKPYDFCLPEGAYGKHTIELPDYKSKVHWEIEDPGNYMYSDEAHARKWLKCYSYDINSAYSFAMTKPMPDTQKKPRMHDLVHKGEMGFQLNGDVTIEEGAYADYIFPMMESPFTPYVLKYFAKKQAAKNEAERENWKYFLNIPTGMMHKKNIFMRNAILFWCADYIKQYSDENTVYCNTDSIVSLTRRTDLPIGDELGQFKEEHVNDNFKYIKPCFYQWNDECHYSGIARGALKDIENTENWQDNLPYKYNKEIRRIIKCQN